MTAPVGYAALPYTVISEPTDAAVQAGIAAWLANRNGPFPKTRLVFAFSGTVKLSTPLLPPDTGQLQGLRWEGLAKGSTVLQWSRADQPLLYAKGQLRNFEFADLTVESTVAGGAGFYFFSSASAANQDGKFRRVEWKGSWNYGIGLDGPTTANLNSEIAFDQPAITNDASFLGAWLWAGMTPANTQEDQFVNYSIRDSKFEGSHGTYLRFDRGGSVTVDGFNSWLHTGQSNNGVPAGTMVVLGGGTHADSVCTFTANRVRAELRSTQSLLINSGWGASGHIAWTGLSDTALAYKVGNQCTAVYRSAAHVSYRDCELGGWHHNTGTTAGQVTYDNCTSKFGNPFRATPITGNGQLRYDTRIVPAVAAR